MENAICNLCNLSFMNKYSLERHRNKKLKCNKITEYKCENCNKCFTQKKSLLSHITKKLCKNIL